MARDRARLRRRLPAGRRPVGAAAAALPRPARAPGRRSSGIVAFVWLELIYGAGGLSGGPQPAHGRGRRPSSTRRSRFVAMALFGIDAVDRAGRDLLGLLPDVLDALAARGRGRARLGPPQAPLGGTVVGADRRARCRWSWSRSARPASTAPRRARCETPIADTFDVVPRPRARHRSPPTAINGTALARDRDRRGLGRCSARRPRACTPSPGSPPVRELARSFAHTLIPIALAYLVAHYFSLVIFQEQAQFTYLLSDPLGRRLGPVRDRGRRDRLRADRRQRASGTRRSAALVIGHVDRR